MLNKATKLFPYFLSLDKEYMAGIKLGVVTDTWDTSGKVLGKGKLKPYSLEYIKKTIGSFVGTQYQTPPIYSALKHKGRPLYAYAREGKKVEVKKRKVSIYHIDILGYCGDILNLKLSCSSGTYVRWLAHAIGQKLGCGAAVDKLTRTRIGRYSLSRAISSDDIEDCFAGAVMGIDQSLAEAVDLFIDDRYKNSIKNGRPLSLKMTDSKRLGVNKIKSGDIIKIKSRSGELLAVHRVEGEPGSVYGFSKPIVII